VLSLSSHQAIIGDISPCDAVCFALSFKFVASARLAAAVIAAASTFQPQHNKALYRLQLRSFLAVLPAAGEIGR